MNTLLTFENLMTLGMLILLQAVLGFDNLLYISLESRKVPADQQARVRRLGIGIAIVLRIVLLLVLLKVVAYFQDPLFSLHVAGLLEGAFNVHSLIVLVGGVFIMYTATKEIFHMLGLEELAQVQPRRRSTAAAICWIVAMNLVFSFDSILSAMALTHNAWVMGTAIIIGGVLMIGLSGRVSGFLQKNRMYEVLGLFILFVVGIMLLSEGGHLAHLSFWGHAITPMSKATFYFVIITLVLTDLVQSRYQRRLQRLKQEDQPDL